MAISSTQTIPEKLWSGRNRTIAYQPFVCLFPRTGKAGDISTCAPTHSIPLACKRPGLTTIGIRLHENCAPPNDVPEAVRKSREVSGVKNFAAVFSEFTPRLNRVW